MARTAQGPLPLSRTSNLSHRLMGTCTGMLSASRPRIFFVSINQPPSLRVSARIQAPAGSSSRRISLLYRFRPWIVS